MPKDDKRLKTEWVEIASPNGYGKIKAYLTRPANATGRLPGIIVVHENRGLNPHIEDIARRLALDNFMALAPGRADAARRLPRRRREGARAVPEARTAQDPRRLRGGGAST